MTSRSVFSIAKFVGEAAVLAIVAVIIVGLVGYGWRWNTVIEYANGFFVVGSLVMIGGLFTRLEFVDRRLSGRLLPGSRDRLQTDVAIRYPWRMVLLGILAGSMLIALSVWVSRLS